MSKPLLHIYLLLFIITSLFTVIPNIGASKFLFIKHSGLFNDFDTMVPTCPIKITTRDTIICSGSSVHLSFKTNSVSSATLPGTWRLLIGAAFINQSAFNIKAFGYDVKRNYLYSILNKKITRYDLNANTSSVIPATNWPGNYTEFTYDDTNNRLLLWRAGRDSVYALPANGGVWSYAGAGSRDNENYNISAYWNPITKRVGFYGGYGIMQVKNWIYENDGNGWVQMRPNLTDCTPPKGGNILAANANKTKLYLFSGKGSCTGNELDNTCALGSGWATANGMFCWLKDLWELDLATYTFKNILPVNDSTIQYEGALTYDYKKGTFYLLGGFQPTNDYSLNQLLNNTNKIFEFNPSSGEHGFSEIIGTSNQPAPASLNSSNGLAYFDSSANRIIWARPDGIWAYYPDSVSYSATKSVLWSTGEGTDSIQISPKANTTYWLQYSDGFNVCTDTVSVKIDTIHAALPAIAYACNGNSFTLNAGAGFNSYLWNTGDTSSQISVNKAGIYSVSVKDSICSAKDTCTVVIVNPPADFNILAQSDSICTNTNNMLYVVNPVSGINYSWYLAGNATIIGTGDTLLLNNIKATSGYVAVAQSTPAVCPSKSAAITITTIDTLSRPIVVIDSVGPTSITFKWNAVVGAIGYLISTDGINYHSPTNGLTAQSETINALLPLQTVSLYVKAISTYSCQSSMATLITGTTTNPLGNNVFIPNSFTPNGDGKNDTFTVYGNAIDKAKISIYNQWGALIFQTEDFKKGWDGTSNGIAQPMGLYSYSIAIIFMDGTKKSVNGSVLLLR